MSSFDEWLRAQDGRDDEVGDLARDFVVDSCRYCGGGVRTTDMMRAHLLKHGAVDGAYDALDQAELEYRR